MATTTKDVYITKTGMPINTKHAVFNLPGATKVFPTIEVNSYVKLEDALQAGTINANEKLMLFDTGDAILSIPVNQIAFHHVAQGTYNNIDWAAAFCACCNMGMAFNPVVDGKLYHFDATGVYHGMAILRDRETGSSWEHATGESIHGQLRGQQFETLSTKYLLVQQVLETIPSALLAIANRSWFHRLLDKLTMKNFLTPRGNMPAPFRLTMGEVDKRLPEMQLGLGMWIDNKARFYSMKTLKFQDNTLIDTFNGEKFIIFVDPVSNVPNVHRCNAASYTWEDNTLVLDTGERIFNGYIQTETSDKIPLDSPQHQFVRWFAFSFKFPDCDIYEE